MKRIFVAFLLSILFLAGCSSSDGTTGNNEQSSNDDAKEEMVTIEVMMFEGGFGSDWVKQSAEEYMAENENVIIEITSSPDIHQQLQTRFLSGDVPALVNPGPNFDIQGVINEGMIEPLDSYLEENAYESEEKWIDTFEPTQFNLQKDGKTYGIPIVFASGYLWWYNESLFEENGWSLPETQEDLYALKEQAAEKDIAVFAIQGKDPAYYFYGIYLPLVERIGGKEAILDAFNLKEGAWKAEAFLEAAKESQRMVDEGLFLEGTFGLTHTEAQTLFFQDKALFTMAGTWLEGEMQDVIPEGFKLRALNQPSYPGGKGEQLAPISTGWGGAWYVPSGAENKDVAIDFLKFLSSEEQVEKMVKARGLSSVVKNTEDAIESEALKSATQVVSSAPGTYAPTAINDAYPELANNILNIYQSLMLGEISPEEFVEQAEEFAEQTRNDANIEKVEFEF